MLQIGRLLGKYDPFHMLGWRKPPTLKEIFAHERVSFVPEEERDMADVVWHGGRVADLVDRIRKGEDVGPIQIDNFCDAGNIYPEVVVLDGHHRLVAAYLLGVETIEAIYGGRTDLLEWLTGQSDKEPQ